MGSAFAGTPGQHIEGTPFELYDIATNTKAAKQN